MLGTSLGSVVWPLLAALSMSYLGWRVGFASLSVGIWLLVLPLLVACLVMPSLQSLGQGPAPVQTKDSKSEEGNGYSISRLVRARPFWTLAMALFVTALVDQALIQHQVMMFDDIGMTFKWAAFGVSAIGLMSFFLRAFVGNILDAGSNKALAILYTTLSLSALIALWLTSPVMLLLYLLFRSVAHTVVVIDIPVMTKHIFGTENLGTLVGLFSFFTYAGFAIGPWVMGRMFDATGSYVYSIVGFVVLPLIASGLVWNLEPKHWLAINAQGAKPQ